MAKRVVINANTPLVIEINQEHVQKAKCKDPAFCVIAQALRDHFGEAVDGFQVGSSLTKIKMDTKLIRYSTGSKLRKALIAFDKTGKWNLPPGRYSLNPVTSGYIDPDKKNRLHTIKKKHKGLSTRKRGRKNYTPSRKALTVYQLANA